MEAGSHTMKHLYIYFLGPFAASLVAPLIYYAMYGTFKPGSEKEKDKVHSVSN